MRLLSIVNSLRKEVTIMITKQELRDEIKAKEQLNKELLKIIDDKNKQIVNLLVELGKYYEQEINFNEIEKSIKETISQL